MTNLKKKDLNARIEKNLKALEVLTKQSSSLDKEGMRLGNQLLYKA